MSLSSSLNFALSGLDVTSRRAEVVSRNVAGADQAGYARRSVAITGPGVGLPGSGVAIARDVDPRLVQLRRDAQARETGASVQQAFRADLDAAIGDPDDPGSLQGDLARLDAAVVSAAASPAAAVRLAELSEAAAGLAARLNGLDAVVQDGRQKADADIGRAVAQLNDDLRDVARLNTDIARLNAGGHGAADLVDQRSVLVDRISRQVPVRELPRDNGVVALVSEGGVLLLDGRPAELGFDPRAPITPEMSAPVHLSGLTVNGRDVQVAGRTSSMAGGGLSALFELRDEIAPEATARLDALAADLVGRFGRNSVDPTLATDQPGLFTDRGAALGAVDRPGLAGRVEVNALVAPDRPDQHWRLRDGLGAAMPGTGADATLLLAYGAALADTARPVAAGLPDMPADLAGHAATLRSLVSSDRIAADDRLAFARTASEGIAEQRDGGAVDIDAEMRRLIEIEQAYAANARIIQVVGDMMNRLTEI